MDVSLFTPYYRGPIPVPSKFILITKEKKEVSYLL